MSQKKVAVIGSKHLTAIEDHLEELGKSNDISTILFERQKEGHKEDMIKKYAAIYQRSLDTMAEWRDEIAKLNKPEKVIHQQLEGTDETVPVNQWSDEAKKKRDKAVEKYKRLCELFDTACEKSCNENYDALDKHLKKFSK